MNQYAGPLPIILRQSTSSAVHPGATSQLPPLSIADSIVPLHIRYLAGEVIRISDIIEWEGRLWRSIGNYQREMSVIWDELSAALPLTR
jgi:hypothetical protein